MLPAAAGPRLSPPVGRQENANRRVAKAPETKERRIVKAIEAIRNA